MTWRRYHRRYPEVNTRSCAGRIAEAAAQWYRGASPRPATLIGPGPKFLSRSTHLTTRQLLSGPRHSSEPDIRPERGPTSDAESPQFYLARILRRIVASVISGSRAARADPQEGPGPRPGSAVPPGVTRSTIPRNGGVHGAARAPTMVQIGFRRSCASAEYRGPAPCRRDAYGPARDSMRGGARPAKETMRPTLRVLEPELIGRILDEAKRVLATSGMEIRGAEMRRRLLELGPAPRRQRRAGPLPAGCRGAGAGTAPPRRSSCTTGTGLPTPTSAAIASTSCPARPA